MWLAATRVRIAPLSADVPVDRLAGGDDREAPRGGDAEGGHGLADDVLAEHRPEGGQPVAAAREPRPPRPLQLDVDEPAGRRAVLAQQDGAAVAEHREAAELVPGVRLGDRPGAGRQVLAREQGRGGFRRHRAEVEAEFVRQPVVQDRHPRRPHRGRLGRGEEDVRQPRVGVVEPPAHGVVIGNRCGRSDHPVPHLVFFSGSAERVLSPWIPIDRVFGVLPEVRRGFSSQSIRHLYVLEVTYPMSSSSSAADRPPDVPWRNCPFSSV